MKQIGNACKFCKMRRGCPMRDSIDPWEMQFCLLLSKPGPDHFDTPADENDNDAKADLINQRARSRHLRELIH